jgi:creatinine amidohydrolase
MGPAFRNIEKHGPPLPLGTDLINIRYLADHAAEEEYAVVFPNYYLGQIFEARHQPGTVAYRARLQLELLPETSDEMGATGATRSSLPTATAQQQPAALLRAIANVRAP